MRPAIEVTDADREAAERYFNEADPSDVFHGTELAEAFARHRLAEREAVVKWLKRENGLCDCFARSEGECGCGAWQDYKTVPLERIWDAIEAGEHLK